MKRIIITAIATLATAGVAMPTTGTASASSITECGGYGVVSNITTRNVPCYTARRVAFQSGFWGYGTYTPARLLPLPGPVPEPAVVDGRRALHVRLPRDPLAVPLGRVAMSLVQIVQWVSECDATPAVLEPMPRDEALAELAALP